MSQNFENFNFEINQFDYGNINLTAIFTLRPDLNIFI